MADIKTKTRGAVKAIDKSIVQTQKFKNNLVTAKEKINEFTNERNESAENYATTKIQGSMSYSTRKGVEKFNEYGKKSIQETKENFIKAKEKMSKIKSKIKSQKAEQTARNIRKRTIKNGVKNTIKTSKQTAKLTKKSIKTTEHAIKNTEKVAKESAKFSQRAVKVAKETTQVAIKGAQATVKATVTAVKTLVASAKALISLLMAGGWVAVIIIVILVVVCGAAASVVYREMMEEKKWGNKMVTVAKTQVEQEITGGEPYWSWYGFDERVEWCACFVSWCADQCGLIEDGVLPKFSLCSDGVEWFKEKNQWIAGVQAYYYPLPGTIIFFDWERDGEVDHVGIVESMDMDNMKITTLEGNSDDACKERTYDWNDARIFGYGNYIVHKGSVY